MKPLLTILILVALLRSSDAAPPAAQGRRLQDISAISTQVLQRSISKRFYKSLLVSPVKGWVLVRADLVGARLSGTRVIHSELNGAYDTLALKLAKEAQIAGYYSIESRNAASVLLHVLIYQIADGTMVLSFPTIDGPGGDQMQYWGCARLEVQKNDGTWTEIKGPEGLQGKGWAVRQGVKDDIQLTFKTERPPGSK